MSGPASEDSEFCWRSVLAQDPWFRLHYNFVSRDVASRVLALHALFAMLERSLSLSEESLRFSQLAWWQAELSPSQSQISAHPVVRALRESGALESLGDQHLAMVLEQALVRLNRAPIATERDLEFVCTRLGWARFSAELTLGAKDPDSLSSEMSCAGTGLALLVQSAMLDAEGGFWFIPLDWQARYQCNTQAVYTDNESGRSVTRALERLVGPWYENQLAELRAASEAEEGLRKHLVAWSLSDRLKIMTLLDSLKSASRAKLSHWGLTDLLRVWWGCMRNVG